MADSNDFSVEIKTFDDFFSCWRGSCRKLRWNCLFVLPAWLKAWWTCFGNGMNPYICAVGHAGDIIGIAPFKIEGATARFMGHSDVCDYQDVIVVPGMETDFFKVVVAHLKARGVEAIDLFPLRPDSIALKSLKEAAGAIGVETWCEPGGESWEMELPASWDEFLSRLTGKQRHEIRRKMRRLEKTASFSFRRVEDVDSVKDAMGVFFDLFRKNRHDKAEFMTPQLTSYFWSLAEAMAETGMIKLFFLDLEEKPAASVMCFDYGDTRYLYNNGYDEQFKSLSVGVLSKVLNIRDGIESGLKRYDFLKGPEAYKRHLGGSPVQLLRCRARIR